eukprot:evm.model.scf_2717.2 EVM.evm.TU.scf_2717.2   scf_2717:9096-14414(+)
MEAPRGGGRDGDGTPDSRKRPGGEGAQGRPTRRRRAMADVARRRAAHFAHYEVADEGGGADGQRELQVGGSEARNLGPWSSARQLVDARAAAVAARKNKIMHAAQEKEQDVEWHPTCQRTGSTQRRAAVKSLYHLTLEVVCEYIDCTNTLQGMPDGMKVELAGMACKKRKLSPEVCKMFVADSPSEVKLLNCTQLDQKTMGEVLKSCATSRLERLELGMCGRGLTDKCAEVVDADGFLGNLQVLLLSGAYQLSDIGVKTLLASTHGQLLVLGLRSCSRISGSVLNEMQELAPKLRSLDLAECRGISGETLQYSVSQLTCLTSLNLTGIPEVSDDVLSAIASNCPLTRISLDLCVRLTDNGIRMLTEACPGLDHLSLDKVEKLTDLGIESIAANCKKLKELGLRYCTKVTDASLSLLASCGTLQKISMCSMPHVAHKTMQSLALSCSNSLELLDVSFCRGVTENSLGIVADSCNSLTELRVFGCSQITKKFLHGHSNQGLEVIGIGTIRAQ